jgi:tetratricopeptide (TPR) repeat protein
MSRDAPDFSAAEVTKMMARGEFVAAEKHLRAKLAREPRAPLPLALLGLALGAQGRNKEGLEASTLATEAEPRFAYAHYARANLLLQLKRPEDALHAAQRAADLDPEDPDFHAFAAEVLAEMGLWEQAHAAVRRALVIDDTHVDATNLRLHLEMRHGPGAEASPARGHGLEEIIDTLGSALERDPENAETHANLAQALMSAGRPKEAIPHLRRALEIDPELPVARILMVEALKSRFAVYRWLVAYQNWTQEAGGLVSLLVIIGGFLVYRNLFALLRERPEWGWVIIPFIVLYLGFVLLSWVGDAVFEGAVLLHPDGQRVLPATSRRRAGVLLGSLAGATTMALVALVSGSPGAYLVAFAIFVSSLPWTQAFVPGLEREWPSKIIALIFLIGTVVLTAQWLMGAFGALLTSFQIFTWAFVANLWLGNLLGAAFRR